MHNALQHSSTPNKICLREGRIICKNHLLKKWDLSVSSFKHIGHYQGHNELSICCNSRCIRNVYGDKINSQRPAKIMFRLNPKRTFRLMAVIVALFHRQYKRTTHHGKTLPVPRYSCAFLQFGCAQKY